MISSCSLRVATPDRWMFYSHRISGVSDCTNGTSSILEDIGASPSRTEWKTRGGANERLHDFQIKFKQPRDVTGHAHVLSSYRWWSNKYVQIDRQCQWPMRRFKRPRWEIVFYSVALRYRPVAFNDRPSPLSYIYAVYPANSPSPTNVYDRPVLICSWKSPGTSSWTSSSDTR